MVLSACVSGPMTVFGETPSPSQPLGVTDRHLVVSVMDDLGQPLDGAAVRFADPSGEHVVASDADGLAAHVWVSGPVTVSVEAPGLLAGHALVVQRPDEPFALFLQPVVLRGTVTDSLGHPIAGADVTLGDAGARSAPDGTFELVRVQPGQLVARRPARAPATLEWSGGTEPLTVPMEPAVIRGLHVSPDAVADPARWQELLDLASETVINAFVVDVKDDSGRVLYASEVERALQAGAVQPILNLDSVLDTLEERDIYSIARVAAFEDPIMARAHPKMAVWDRSLDRPYSINGHWYLDPSDEEARAYAIEIAAEVCRMGFAEVQFDFVGYPVSISTNTVFDGGSTEDARVGALRTFLAEATAVLNQLGCAAGATVLGFTTSIDGDGGVGEDFRLLTEVTDVLSPTVYPSAYSEGWFGLDAPGQHPGIVVGRALDDGLERIQGPAIIRPWLQDYSYSVAAVRAQIEAAEERGMGWLLWNGQSRFSESALPVAKVASEGSPG